MTIDGTMLLKSGRCLGQTAHEHAANAASPPHTTATRKSWECDVSCGPNTSQDGTICTHPRPPTRIYGQEDFRDLDSLNRGVLLAYFDFGFAPPNKN